jgi:hypothetical protein
VRKHLSSLSPARRWGGSLLAGLGVAVLLVEVILSRWIRDDGISWSTVAVGSIIGYVGFSLLNGRAARQQGQFLVDSTVRIVGTIRKGRQTQVLTTITEPPQPDAAPDAERSLEEPPPEKQ